MRARTFMALAALVAMATRSWAAQAAGAVDPRVREVIDDGRSVITVSVRAGVATEIDLEPGESIVFAATGYGSDCEAKAQEASWCIAALPGQHVIFVKPRSNAAGQNNLQLVTRSGHSYSFVFELLGKSDRHEPVYRLQVRLSPMPPPAPREERSLALATVPPMPALTPAQQVAQRLDAAVPQVVNSAYSLAIGKGSEDIVPNLIFDDGRFTYFRFAGNREIPAVFQRAPDGAESLANAQMQDDLLRIDRVGRQFYLRMGNQAVRVWNDAFDLNGVPATGATTVAGVERATKLDASRALGEQP